MSREWTRCAATAAAFCCLLVGVEPQAFAQPQSAGIAVSRESDSKLLARDLMRRGVEEYRKNNLEGARASFARAWELEHHSAIAASLADVEVRLGRYREAAEHWSFYLKNAPPERDRTDAERGLAECKKHVARLGVTTEAKAAVSVDGHAAGEASLLAEFWLDPGAHVVEVRPASGGATATERVVLAAGEEKQINLAAGAGVASSPPVTRVPSVASPASSPQTAPAQGRAGESGVSTRSTVVITGSALTVVATVVGVVYGLKAQRVSDDADTLTARINMGATDAVVRANRACNPPSGEPSDDCSFLAEKVDAAKGARTTSQVAFVAAGALGIGTLAALLFWPAHQSTGAHGLVVAPWQAGKSYGLFAQGSY